MMPEFLQLENPTLALKSFLEKISLPNLGNDRIPTTEAVGRVIAAAVLSPESSPAFSRSTVDGFAVRARDTFGASEGIPVYLSSLGELRMGKKPAVMIEKGKTIGIHTGGMLPDGSDAVVMVENIQVLPNGEIEITKSVSPGENMIREGEDVKLGEEIIQAGRLLRPVEIGGLLAVGITVVEVRKEPRVGILSSGDELVDPRINPKPGQVRDINSYMIASLISRNGGVPVTYELMPDDPISIQESLQKAFRECDALVITAGSSTSTRDFTSQAILKLGSPGILNHGLNIKPGKPTILAVCDGKPVIGLPGNPVSALVIATLFVIPMIMKIAGVKDLISPEKGRAKLAINLPSLAGREDYWPIKIEEKDGEIIANPIFYKSNLIFSLVNANALAIVPTEVNGLAAGESIEYFRLM
jgi:molybdopterin molybdotransferase